MKWPGPLLLLTLLAVSACVARTPAPSAPAPVARPSASAEAPPRADVRRHPEAPASLGLAPGYLARLRERTDLAGKIRQREYTYFRLIHESFTTRVCRAFAGDLHAIPPVNLHGDAHIEQYAVTTEAHGLDDFDEAGVGPGVVDLVRFAVSLRLACETLSCDGDAAVEAFLAAYQSHLATPAATVPTPAVVRRLRRDQRPEEDYFAFGERSMEPLGEVPRRDVADSWRRTTQLLRSVDRSHPASFFALKRAGRLGIGVGSALVPKFLLRIEGPTTAPDDDLLVEIKQHEAAATSCVARIPGAGVLAPQVMQARMGRIRSTLVAYVPNGYPGTAAGPDAENWAAWVHAWSPSYRELTVQDLRSAAELSEVARDVAAQLATGHTRDIMRPFGQQHRVAVEGATRRSAPRVLDLSRALRRELRAAWEQDRRRL